MNTFLYKLKYEEKGFPSFSYSICECISLNENSVFEVSVSVSRVTGLDLVIALAMVGIVSWIFC